MKLIGLIIASFPCALVCAVDSPWLNLLGFIYMGAWLWIAYALLKNSVEYEERDK